MSKASFTYHTLAIAAAISISTMSQGQYVTDYKRAGDRFYAKGDYNSAAQYYEKYLAGKNISGYGIEPYQVHKEGKVIKSDATVDLQYKLAESYRMINDYAHAEGYYKNVSQEAASQYPLSTLWYAISLRANGKYAEAKQSLNTFIDSYKTNDAYLQQAKQELANVTFIQNELNKTTNVVVNKLSSQVNKEGANYAAGWLNSNVVFTSTSNQGHVNDLYTASGNDYSDVQKLNVPFAKGKEQGTATFTADGNKVYFTRWTNNNAGDKQGIIYESSKSENGWSEPVVLNEQVNYPGSDNRQPQITADGKYLLFASNRQGGKGGFDIWFAPIENGVMGNAVNAGSAINTKGDEEAPFYHAASKTLVFASNGKTGMGGFDLFSATGKIGGTWAEAVNIGAPVNSVKDDIYFVSNGKKLLENALISSDRSSQCCLELFAVNKTYKQYLVGKVMNCSTNEPLDHADIVLQNAAGKTIGAQTTGGNGYYIIETLPGEAAVLKVNKADFEAASISVANTDADTLYNNAVCMTAVKKDIFEGKKTLVTHDINFAFRQKDLTPDSYPYLDEVAAYLKDHADAKLEIDAHTDGIGTMAFNKKLSQQRADACVDYLVKAGIAKERLIAKGFGESAPIEKETTKDGKDIPEAREKNRRVEMRLQ
ncbi:OmpA family protein [Pinibacter aurantiacus]|uniref:OmpA family protein n=1 Tax=Pinibacter aurantiacus TaxID=2851599 RepID=A0A9E2S756_9BACT|nr:OmpA family protein [Pinibacter aurantiacus]MBV4355704.1 OmpA family protein [Pinibacter aurantiacus]